MDCSDDEVLIVSGSLQALDLVNETFLKEGDTVIIEESSYGGVFTRLNYMKVNVKGIPVQEDGMDLSMLEETLVTLKNQGIVPRSVSYTHLTLPTTPYV